MLLGDQWYDLSLEELYSGYGQWISMLMKEPLWSPDFRSGRRMPWRLVLGSGLDDLGLRGLYLFANAKGEPRYIGKAQTESLRDRLSGRYLSGPFSQFQIAATYSEALRKGGWKSLPDEIIARYLRNQSKRFLSRHGWTSLGDKSLAEIARSGKGTTVRLRHAEDLAKQGIEGIWIGLVPVSSSQRVSALEEKVVRVAWKWNTDMGYAPLMNKQLVDSFR